MRFSTCTAVVFVPRGAGRRQAEEGVDEEGQDQAADEEAGEETERIEDDEGGNQFGAGNGKTNVCRVAHA